LLRNTGSNDAAAHSTWFLKITSRYQQFHAFILLRLSLIAILMFHFSVSCRSMIDFLWKNEMTTFLWYFDVSLLGHVTVLLKNEGTWKYFSVLNFGTIIRVMWLLSLQDLGLAVEIPPDQWLRVAGCKGVHQVRCFCTWRLKQSRLPKRRMFKKF